MKPITNPFHYFKVKQLQSSSVAEFTALADFISFLQTQQIKTVFIAPAAHETTVFAVPYHGTMLTQLTEGFKTLEDFQAAEQNNFPDAATYYTATAKGYKQMKDYEWVMKMGVDDKAVFDKMQQGGFLQGFETWKQQYINPDLNIPVFENAYALFEYAMAAKFENYQQFADAIQKGFKTFMDLQVAAERGFYHAAQYQDALNRGFFSSQDYHYANEKKIRTHDELVRYLDFEIIAQKHLTIEQKILLITVSRLPQKRKIPFDKIDELFQKALDEYRYADTHQLPEWLEISMIEKADRIKFLNDDVVKEYGSFYPTEACFETKKLQDRKIVLDGSNVAHNSQGNPDSKPTVENMKNVVKELRSRGIDDITVIADASLKHKLIDIEKLAPFKETVKYIVAPAETAADVFIINYVKAHNCLVLSNDNYKEWKAKAPWVEHNIDFYRLTFQIKGDRVLLPDLDA